MALSHVAWLVLHREYGDPRVLAACGLTQGEAIHPSVRVGYVIRSALLPEWRSRVLAELSPSPAPVRRSSRARAAPDRYAPPPVSRRKAK